MDTLKLDNLLKLISDAVSETCTVSTYIPSADKPVTLKALTILQQKILISAAVDTEVYNSKFVDIFYKILNENYLSEIIQPLHLLTVLDKVFIALALRANINNSLSLQNFQVDIAVVLDQLKALITSRTIPTDPGSFTHDNITVHYTLPTISTEVECEEAKIVLKTENTTEQFKHILSETVTDELSKFINKIVIDKNTIILQEYTAVQRKKIIEQLPALVLEQALSYILNYKQSVERALTVSDDTHTNTIQINSSFFATA